MLRILLLLSIIGLALAAAPKPCCTPKQWEGHINIAGSNLMKKGNKTNTYLVSMHVSYDYKNMRLRIDEKVFPTGAKTSTNVTIIGDFKKAKKIYTVINGKCTTVSTKNAMAPACIPKNATYVTSGTIGGALAYNTFAFKSPNIGAILGVTKKTCIPIYELAYENLKVQGKALTTRILAWFKNVTAGIKKPSVFNRPKECKSSEDQENVIVDFDWLQYYYSRLSTIAKDNNMIIDGAFDDVFDVNDFNENSNFIL